MVQLVSMKLSARFQLINESWTLFVQSHAFKNPSWRRHIMIILPCLNPDILIKFRKCVIFPLSPHHPSLSFMLSKYKWSCCFTFIHEFIVRTINYPVLTWQISHYIMLCIALKPDIDVFFFICGVVEICLHRYQIPKISQSWATDPWNASLIS